MRREWASLVATPSYARFQDALAFTRSLGDLHLHTYGGRFCYFDRYLMFNIWCCLFLGVTHLPEVQSLNLSSLFQQISSSSTPLPTTNDNISKNCIAIVLASDGVWDNWLYEDVGKFVMDNSCLQALQSLPDGAQKITDSFMQRNTMFSKKNFGSQADNATAIILYISVDQS